MASRGGYREKRLLADLGSGNVSGLEARGCMQIVVLGAGVVGVCTAWHLLQRGHGVTLIERQPEAEPGAGHVDAGQTSASLCAPWASPRAPANALRRLMRGDMPDWPRPQFDPFQWRWSLAFASQCTQAAFERNFRHLVALGRYSQSALHTIVERTGLEYQAQRRGILQFFTEPQDLVAGARRAALLLEQGLQPRMLTTSGVIDLEPALARFSSSIVGGLYAPDGEAGDLCMFTQALQKRCAEAGARFLFGHEVEGFEQAGGQASGVRVLEKATGRRDVQRGDAYVLALGAWTAPLLRSAGLDGDIHPVKGYSATLKVLQPERANAMSLIDEDHQLTITRLGDYVCVAGSAEMAGYDATVSAAHARRRCHALVRRFEQLFPGVADTSYPQYGASLHASTPSGVPLIGRTRLEGLWINAGHGVSGWSHGPGSGQALALLMSGESPLIDFPFQTDMSLRRAGPGARRPR